jgi:hypothetical protein
MSDPSFPIHIIYALVDPRTHQVRYVGKTSKPIGERLGHHVGAARRNVKKPVYDWIRGLHPTPPIIIVLQEVRGVIGRLPRGDGTYENAIAAAETKWMKRFERSQLLCEIPRSARAYRRLVNVEESVGGP